MKTIKFNQETNITTGDIWYYTSVNEQPVSGSFSKDRGYAYDIFLKVVENKGDVKKQEVIEVTTI